MRSKLQSQIIPLLIAICMLVTINLVEYLFFPVVRDFTVLQMEVTADTVTMSGFMRKVRNCRYLGASAVTEYDNGTDDEARINLSADAVSGGNGVTRPVGTSAWGPCRITIPTTPKTVAIRLTFAHDCFPMWATRTAVGSFPLVGRP